MARQNERRSTTLSISLTPELASVISTRVRSGLYASASELVREALRLLLKVEQRQNDSPSAASDRFEAATELQELGLAMTAQRLRREEPGLTDTELRSRIHALADDDDTDVGLRAAPARLKRLQFHGQEE